MPGGLARIPYGETANLLRGQDIIAQEAAGRPRQHVGDVVKAIARFVCRQQGSTIDLYTKQITNSVRVSQRGSGE